MSYPYGLITELRETIDQLVFGCKWHDKGVLWAGELLIRQECTRCHSQRTVAA